MRLNEGKQMNDELYHSRGAWKNHKYLKKIGNRYIYAKDQIAGAVRNAGPTVQQMRAQASKQVANAKRAARQAIVSGRQTAKHARVRFNEFTGVNAKKRMKTYAGDYLKNQKSSAKATSNYRKADSEYQRAKRFHDNSKTMMRRPTPNSLKGEARTNYNKQVGSNYNISKKRLDIETQKRNSAMQEMAKANKRTQTSKRNYEANKNAYQKSIAGKVDNSINKAKRIAKQKGQASRRALNKMIGVGAKERRDVARREYARTTANAAKAQQNANNVQRSADYMNRYAKNLNSRTNAAMKGQTSQAAKEWSNKRRTKAKTLSSHYQKLANDAQGKANTSKRYANNARNKMNEANKAYNNSLIGKVDKAKSKGREVFNDAKRKASGVYNDFKKGKYGTNGGSENTIKSKKLSSTSSTTKKNKTSTKPASKPAKKKNRRTTYNRTTSYRRPI